MSNEVSIRITADSTSGKRALGDVQESLKRTSTEAKATGKAVGDLGDSLNETERDAIGTARAVESVDDQLRKLERDAATSRASLKMLAAALVDTDDAAQRLDIRKAMSKVNTDLNTTLKAQKALKFDLEPPSPSAAAKFFEPFSRAGQSAFGSIGATAGPALAVGAVAAAPLIAATLSAAVVGGAGAGGIIGGVALAAQDPRVKVAGSALGRDLLADLEDRSKVVVEPLLRSMDKVRAGWGTIGKDMDRVFSRSATMIGPLTDSLMRGSQSLLHGVADAVDESGPVVAALGDSFEELSGAVGDTFSLLASDADEGARAIGDITDATRELIQVTGGTVHALSTVYGWYGQISDKSKEWLGLRPTDVMWGPLASVKAHMDDVSEAEARMREEADNAADGTKHVADAMDAAERAARGELSALEDLSRALRAQTDPAFAVLDAQDKLAEAQRNLADATRKGGKDSVEAQEALRRFAEASLDLEGKVGALGDTFDGQMPAALRRTLIAAGATEETLAGVAQMFRDAKAAGEAFDGSYNAEVRTLFINEYRGVTKSAAAEGYEAAQAEIRARQRRRRRADGGIDIAMAGGGITQAGIYPASDPPLVQFAEPSTGGEAYIPKNGDRSRNLSILEEVASWPSVNAQVVPMASGGITRSGGSRLINVAPQNSPSGSRLDSAAAYLSARDAVASLSASLKENGRTLDSNTRKGRENLSQVHSAIRAAQDAARAKYEETGSVKAANQAYDEHITRLRRVMQQRGVSDSSTRRMIGLASRPTFGGGFVDSSANIAFARDKMSLIDAAGGLRDTFKAAPGIPAHMARSMIQGENLGPILDFFEQAGRAAQSRYAQTGSAKSAAALYNSSLSTLRSILGGVGVRKADADRLIGTYGRITLGAAASGGIRQGLTWVGEQGPELVNLPGGSTVYPAGQSRQMATQMTAEPVDVRLSVDPAANSKLINALVEAFRYEIRTKSGGSVQRHLGQPGVS